MKDEIKEIIEYISSRTVDDILLEDYFKELEDYITNLQEENKTLKELKRLNNVINELEKDLEQEYAIVKANSIEEPNNPEWYIKWNERKNILDKLKLLKEGK